MVGYLKFGVPKGKVTFENSSKNEKKRFLTSPSKFKTLTLYFELLNKKSTLYSLIMENKNLTCEIRLYNVRKTLKRRYCGVKFSSDSRPQTITLILSLDPYSDTINIVGYLKYECPN